MAVERPFRDLCPQADLRDAMSDGEFWQQVGANLGFAISPVESEDDEDLSDALIITVCATCGSMGACGYDSEGRALIHVTDQGED